MAAVVRRYTVGRGQDFEDIALFEAIVPEDTLEPYVATLVGEDGTRATPGVWVAIVSDDTFASGRHDLGTIVEEQVGIEERKPRAHADVERFLRRIFIVNGRPGFAIKLQKLPVGGQSVMSRAAARAAAQDTVKGHAELMAGTENGRMPR